MRNGFLLLAIAAALGAGPVARGQSISSFQAGDGGWQLSSPAVGNIDADPGLEIVTAYRNSSGQWLLDAHKPDGSRAAGFPYHSGGAPINVSPTLFDLDGDGRAEILVTAGPSILALRGNGSVLWQHTVSSANYVPNAGFQAVTNGFYLSGLGPLQPTLPPTAEFSSEVSPPIVVDLEGDGSLEVLTAWKINPDKLGLLQDFNPFLNDTFGLTEWGLTGEVWSGGVILSDARTGAREFTYHFHQLVEAGLAVAQLDRDRALEILVLNDADSVVAFDITQPPGFLGSGMLHEKFGKNLRLLSGSYLAGVEVEAADIDGDGLDEVLVAGPQRNPNWQPSDTILDDDGALLWREWKQPADISHVHGWPNNAVLIPVNPDHDHRVDVLGFSHANEITFRYWNGIELASHPGWPKNFGSHLPSPPVVGDVDGDGVQEIVIATYAAGSAPSSGKLLVYALNGTEKNAIDIPGGVKHIPTLADLDRDGRTEVVLRSLAGRIYIVKFGAGGTGHPDWPTHRGNPGRSQRHALYPAGTPIITAKTGAHQRAEFSWRTPAGYQPASFKILRAENPAGPFAEIATLGPDARSFTANGLVLGRQSIFEVQAIYPAATVRSAPFAIAAELNNNRIVNGGFEQDDDSHWDKWFAGDIPWTDMTASTAEPHAGQRSMEIKLRNKGSGSTITQSSHYGVPRDYLPVSPGVLYSFGGFVRAGAFDQPVEHWFEWDSSRTAENPSPRPPLPYPNYFTPSLKTGTAPAPWTYLNRVFEMPAGFSNVELRHRYRTPAPASGSVFLDDIFFRALPSPDATQWAHWIPFRSIWRHLSSTPPANWFASSFDDSAWPEGKAKFGQGSGPQNIVTVLPKNQPAHYFRKSFTGLAGAHELLLAATCTDDYGGQIYPMRVWINGTEIPGKIEAVSGEGNVEKYFDLAPYVHLIHGTGENVIAVMLANTWQPSWDNVAFDLSLRAIMPPPRSPETGAIERIFHSPEGAVTLQLRSGLNSTWQLEHTASLGHPWAVLADVQFPSGGATTIQTPAAAASGFFRLVPEPQ